MYTLIVGIKTHSLSQKLINNINNSFNKKKNNR